VGCACDVVGPLAPQYSTYNPLGLFPPSETYKFVALGSNSAAPPAGGIDFTVHSVGVRLASYLAPLVYTLTSDVATVTKTLDVAVQGAPYTSVVEDARPPRRPVPNTPDGWYYHKDATDTSAAKTNWYLARSGVRSLMAGVVSGRVAGAGCGVWGMGCGVWAMGRGLVV
jgi:hypothetical protein